MALPMGILWKAKLNLRQKLGLGTVFCLYDTHVTTQGDGRKATLKDYAVGPSQGKSKDIMMVQEFVSSSWLILGIGLTTIYRVL